MTSRIARSGLYRHRFGPTKLA